MQRTSDDGQRSTLVTHPRSGKLFWKKIRPARGRVLSKKEKQVARLLCEGYTYQEIADRAGSTRDAVKFHMNNIIRRLGANNCTHAAVMIVRENLL